MPFPLLPAALMGAGGVVSAIQGLINPDLDIEAPKKSDYVIGTDQAQNIMGSELNALNQAQAANRAALAQGGGTTGGFLSGIRGIAADNSRARTDIAGRIISENMVGRHKFEQAQSQFDQAQSAYDQNRYSAIFGGLGSALGGIGSLATMDAAGYFNEGAPQLDANVQPEGFGVQAPQLPQAATTPQAPLPSVADIGTPGGTVVGKPSYQGAVDFQGMFSNFWNQSPNNRQAVGSFDFKPQQFAN